MAKAKKQKVEAKVQVGEKPPEPADPRSLTAPDRVKHILMSSAAAFGDQLVKVITTDVKPLAVDDGFSWGVPSINYICTGNPLVGVPRGVVVEIFGPESSGKTTLTLQHVAEVQRAGGVAGYIDAEHALSLKYAQDLGVNIGNMLFSQPDSGEQCIDVALLWIKEGADTIVFDSVAHMVPMQEAEASAETANIGAHARLMGRAMRKLVGPAKKYGCSLIFINQTREKVGVMFGSPETTTGGHALRFAASIRLRTSASIASKKAIQSEYNSLLGRKDKEKLGTLAAIDCRKNKCYRPFLNTEVPIMYGKGYDIVSDAFDWAVSFGLAVKKQGGYEVAGQRVTYAQMADHLPDLMDVIAAKYAV